MKKFILALVMAGFMLSLMACGKESAEKGSAGESNKVVVSQESDMDGQENEFVLGENLAGAITELALKYDEFDIASTKEESYPEIFISTFCQNNRFTFD